MAVRVFAVGVLVVGLGVGLTAGYLKQQSDELHVRSLAEGSTEQTVELPAPVGNNPQARPPGARIADARREAAALSQAQQRARARADAAADAAEARAAAAAKAAKDRADAKARADRERASRSENRSGTTGGTAPAVPVDCKTYTGNRQIGCSLLSWAGFGTDQMTCLDSLFKKESGWNERAENPSSGAYGIPQSLPGNKMAEYGDDWQTNPVTQIKWGLMYIKKRYGTPCAAWGHSQSVGWY